MIYHFSWNSHYLVSTQVKAWKDKFIEKYWEFNLAHIKDIVEADYNFLTENILSRHWGLLFFSFMLIVLFSKEKKRTKTSFEKTFWYIYKK